jgi:hypothetical protein
MQVNNLLLLRERRKMRKVEKRERKSEREFSSEKAT